MNNTYLEYYNKLSLIILKKCEEESNLLAIT